MHYLSTFVWDKSWWISSGSNTQKPQTFCTYEQILNNNTNNTNNNNNNSIVLIIGPHNALQINLHTTGTRIYMLVISTKWLWKMGRSWTVSLTKIVTLNKKGSGIDCLFWVSSTGASAMHAVVTSKYKVLIIDKGMLISTYEHY